MATTKGKMYLGDTLISGSQIYEYSQTPTLVQSFIDEVTYDSSDYTTSQIGNYAPATPNVSNTYPIGVSIDGITYYNHIPNQYSAILIEDNQSAVVKPTHSLRQIKSAFAVNVRDLGGWKCDGGTVKYGKLFRGGEINVNDRDVLVNQCGVMYELNLRGVEESNNRTESPLGNDIGYSLFEGNSIWYSISNKDIWKSILRVIFNNVIYDIPTYYHCAVGADRTGTLSCIIEAILGVSQSDIDKDYELTSFDTGTSTDTVARRRNETDWTNLINAINSLSVGSTFRDKVINWVASLGFTVEEINDFRSAMIDGTPSTITLDIDTFTITKTSTNVSYDNNVGSIAEYQPYIVNITPNNGYLIDDVVVKMGGVDITKQVFDGKFMTNGTLEITENGEYDIAEYENVIVDIVSGGVQYTVTKTLNQSTSNNTLTETTSEQSYGAIITPNDGYNISTLVVKMGGTDITSSVVTLIEEV